MGNLDILTVQVLSVAGPALAFGFILGWVLAVTHFGGSTGRSNPYDSDSSCDDQDHAYKPNKKDASR